MSLAGYLVIAVLCQQATAIRPIEAPKPKQESPTEEAHAKVLPSEVALSLLGSYTLDKPLSTGEREFYATIVDDKARLRIGETDRLMVYEQLAYETVDGVRTDVYGFTIVGRPGMTVQFKVLNKRVQYVNIFEDFADPPVVATGKPKRR